MEAEERTTLLKTLYEGGFVTNDVESYLRKQEQKRFCEEKGKNKKKQDEPTRKWEMLKKINDNEEYCHEMRKSRNKLREGLRKLMGKDKKEVVRSWLKKMKKGMDILRARVREKYKTKIKTLKSKQEIKFELPEELRKYESMRVFKMRCEDELSVRKSRDQ